MIYRHVLKVGLIVCLSLVNFQLLADDGPIKFGSVAMDVPADMHKRLTPLTKYLSDSLGQPVSLKLAKDMPEAIQDISKGQVDLAYLTPVAYIRSNADGNAQPIVKLKTNNKASFKLMIVVREDSPIQSVEDLIGKSFAFGDKAALLQRAVVVGAGLPLEKLGSYHYLRHYDNIVRAVLLGEYDAGILKDTKAYNWKGKGIRILYSSPELPPYNIAASSKVSPQIVAKLKKAFLNLDINKPDHYSIIKALDKKYDGFAPASDSDYDIVRQLIKPFDNKY
jgi:phosphonate transport system substrate-binding protein